MSTYNIEIGASYAAGDLQYLASPYSDGGFEPVYATPSVIG